MNAASGWPAAAAILSKWAAVAVSPIPFRT